MKYRIIEKKEYKRGYFNKYSLELNVGYRIEYKKSFFAKWEMRGWRQTLEAAEVLMDEFIEEDKNEHKIQRKLLEANRTLKEETMKEYLFVKKLCGEYEKVEKL
jgi:hypothetical protein